ncbi:MAG: helix-turn-helix transcriptional regulator [Chloroflexota bacterium]
MATTQRTYDRGKQRGDRLIRAFGHEVLDARLSLGLSQQALADAVRMPASKISRIEHAKLPSLSIIDAAIVASAVGLDLSARTYPGGAPTRDAGHARHLQSLLAHARPPLRYRTEVRLPFREGVPEQRAWDALVSDGEGQTGVELEQRLYDLQAQTRRILLRVARQRHRAPSACRR